MKVTISVKLNFKAIRAAMRSWPKLDAKLATEKRGKRARS